MQNNRQNELIRAIIEKKLREEAQTQQLQNSSNPLDRINGISNRVGNFGEGLSNTGNFLGNKFSSMSKLTNGMQKVGNALQTGANAVKNVIPTSSSLMNTIGSKIGSAVGSGAATGAATSAATTAGTTAGATTAGASAGAGAAGGSAASGAAAAGPIGALVALGVMALQGTNRKRAKQSGQQAQQLAETQVDIAKDRLAQTSQIAEQLGNQYMPQNNINQNMQDNYFTQFGGDTQSLIDSYIQSNMPQGDVLENAINSYVNNPAPIADNPQTDEQTKQGIFNKLANGLSDFMTGYKENRENGFNPNNLLPEENKGFMQRVGEGFGTTARMIHNPIAQGLVAGGLSTALTGNPLYGLGMANKFANNKMNSDLYQQILKNQGVNFDNYNGVITSDDMSKILTANKYQKGFMTRKDYDRLRLENGLISVDEYNQGMSAPDYNPDEMINLSGIETVSKAGRNMQQNKNDKSTNYYRAKNEGKNVVKVEYGEKPDSHNYTHVTYGAKPEQKSTTHITYGEKPQSNNSNGGKKDNTPRIKVKSPDGKVGSIPASQLAEAIKKGFKKL